MDLPQMSKKLKGFTLLKCLSLQQSGLEEPYIAYSKFCTDDLTNSGFFIFHRNFKESPQTFLDAVTEKN